MLGKRTQSSACDGRRLRTRGDEVLLCNNVWHGRQDQSPFLLTLLSQSVLGATFLVFQTRQQRLHRGWLRHVLERFWVLQLLRFVGTAESIFVLDVLGRGLVIEIESLFFVGVIHPWQFVRAMMFRG